MPSLGRMPKSDCRCCTINRASICDQISRWCCENYLRGWDVYVQAVHTSPDSVWLVGLVVCISVESLIPDCVLCPVNVLMLFVCLVHRGESCDLLVCNIAQVSTNLFHSVVFLNTFMFHFNFAVGLQKLTDVEELNGIFILPLTLL